MAVRGEDPVRPRGESVAAYGENGMAAVTWLGSMEVLLRALIRWAVVEIARGSCQGRGAASSQAFRAGPSGRCRSFAGS